jgi:23S rRNA pseudouridine1911/1915/1917 synthase
MIELTVPNEYAGWRLDRYLAAASAGIFPLALAGFDPLRRRAARGKTVRTRETVQPGNVVRLTIPPSQEVEAQPEEIPLQILFEDDDLLILNKPAGLGCSSRRWQSIAYFGERSPSSLPQPLRDWRQAAPGNRSSTGQGNERLPGGGEKRHRSSELARQFAGREVTKIYLALVNRKFEAEPWNNCGSDRAASGAAKEDAVDSRRGREARTDYRGPSVVRRRSACRVCPAQRTHPSDSAFICITWVIP